MRSVITNYMLHMGDRGAMRLIDIARQIRQGDTWLVRHIEYVVGNMIKGYGKYPNHERSVRRFSEQLRIIHSLLAEYDFPEKDRLMSAIDRLEAHRAWLFSQSKIKH